MSSRLRSFAIGVHLRVAAPAFLEVLQLQVEVARGLAGEDRDISASVELPFGPWQATQTSAFFAPASDVLRDGERGRRAQRGSQDAHSTVCTTEKGRPQAASSR